MTNTRRRWPLASTASPLKSALIYFVIAGLWILVSDSTLLWLTQDLEVVSRAQTIKGVLFVLAMSLLVYTLIRRELEISRAVHQEVITSEAHYRQMFERNRSIQWLVDPETGAIVDANQAAADYYGYPREALRQMRVAQINTLPDAALRVELERAQREQLSYFTFKHRLASGEARDVEVVASPIELGGRTLIYSIIHDISDRRRAEAALQDSERRFRAIFDQTFQFISLLTPSGIILEANQTGLEFAGLAHQAVVGRPLWEVSWWDSATHERIRQAVERAAQGRFVRFEVEMRGAGRAVVMIDLSVKPIRDDSGSVTLLIVEGRDINDLRRAVTALRESNQTLEALVDASPLPIIALDRTGHIKMWNPAAEQVFGWSSNETLGRPVPLVDERDEAAFRSMFDAMLGGLSYSNIEMLFRHKDGKLIDVSVSSGPLRDAKAEIGGAMVLVADITEQKRAAAALAQSEAELRALFEAMTDVIVVLDAEARYVKIAPTGQTLLVQPADQLLGKTLYQVLPREQAVQFHDYIRLALQTNAPVKVEYQVSTQGVERWFAATVSPMLGDRVIWVARDITEQRRADALQAALYRIAEITSTAEDMQSFFAAVHGIIGQLMVARNLYIALHDPETGLLTFSYWVDETEPVPAPVTPERGLTGTVFRTGRPLLISAEIAQEREARGDLDRLGTPSIDWLGVPLKRGDETFGVLAVQSYTPEVRFSEKDLELLTFVSQHIASALERKQAAEALRQSEERYRSLIETSPDAVTYTDINATVIWTNQQSVSLLGLSSPDDLLGRSAFEFVAPEDQERSVANARATLERGYVRGVEYTGLRADGTRFPAELSASLLTDAEGHPRGFVGVTRDITERKRAEEALWRRDAILSALASASERLLLEDPMDILPEILALLGKTIGVSRAYLFQNHRSADGRLLTTQRFEWVAPGITPQIDNPDLTDFDYAARGFDRYIDLMSAGQPLYGLVSEFPQAERTLLEAQDIRSIVEVPIFSAGQWWGFLGFDECLRDWVWQSAEIEALRSAAGALGAAFARQEIRAAEREQRALAEALRDSAAALSSTLNLDEVFERILANLGHVVPHDAANIMLIQGDTARIIRRRGYAEGDWAARAVGMTFSVSGNPTTLGRIAQTGEALLIHDTACYDGWREVPETAWIRSCLAAPICRHGEVVGFIHLYGREAGFFQPMHVRRLQALADQAAVALQNAWLYESERKQLQLAQTLQAVGALLTSQLSLDDVLEQILDLLGEVIEYDRVSVHLLEAGRFEMVASRGHTNPERMREAVHDLSPELYDQRWKDRDIAVISDTSTDPSWLPIPEAPPIGSWIGAALRVKGRLIGNLNVDRVEVNAFSPDTGETVLAFANQAAVAIENARLYRESQEQIKRLALLNEITRIGTATLNMNELLETLADTAGQIVGGDGCYITFWDPVKFLTIPMAASGPMRGMYPSQKPTGRESPTLTRWVLELGRPIAVDDVFHSEYVDGAIAEKYPTRSMLALPLTADRRDLGALLIGYNQPHHFEEDEIQWAEQAAELISLAIAKAQAYSRLEERVEQRTEELKQANQKLTLLTQHKDEFVANVSHELRTPITSIKLYHHLLKSSPEKFESYMERLDRETERLEFIIEDLLRLSELDRDEMQLNALPTDLNSLASLYVTDRQPVAQERSLLLSFNPDSSLPPVAIDQMLVGQALSVILTNALNYTPPGGSVAVATQQLPLVGENWAIISVRDTGPGIPAEEQPMLFQRFYRGRVGKDSRTEGTGLGLAIAREIVERHGGRIEVISEEGKGATFSIWLPITENNTGGDVFS